MVHYIRFLKAPKLDVRKRAVRALITITTDLGDDFYRADVNVYATLVLNGSEQEVSEWKTFKWKQGMRCLWVEMKLGPYPLDHMKLVISSHRSSLADNLLLHDMPKVLSAWSQTFGPGIFEAGNKIERRLKLESGHDVVIYEEMGESIARHIWDAGIALAAFLSNIVERAQPSSPLTKVVSRSFSGLKVLELGSGCGVVGLQIGHLCPTSNVFLTDLPEAMEILDYNVGQAKQMSDRVNIQTTTLDWAEPLPGCVAERQHDLVIISDCTYNSSSIPALVKTLAALMKRSPTALIVVSTKARHDSEAVFFDLMNDAGLGKLDHSKIGLPNGSRSVTGQTLETVDIYVYCNPMDQKSQEHQ